MDIFTQSPPDTVMRTNPIPPATVPAPSMTHAPAFLLTHMPTRIHYTHNAHDTTGAAIVLQRHMRSGIRRRAAL